MDKNNYLENISAKLGFARDHWRIIVFLLSAAFLFYVAMLSIDITAEMNTYPSSDEVNKKFLTVKIKKDVISEIDRFFAFKGEHLAKYLENPINRDPFSSYGPDSAEPTPEPSATPVVSAD